MKILNNKIQNKKILIAGGLGFIGSHFVELLNDNCEDCEIHIYDNFSTKISNIVADNISEININSKNSIAIFHLDINDTNIINYDYAVNLAEYNYEDNSPDTEEECVTNNIMAVYNLLSRCVKSCKFLHVSSLKVYGNKTEATLDSNPNPSSIYGATKACSDILATTFVNKHDKNISIVRLPSVFGPRQSIDKFIPNTILRASKDMVIDIVGNDYSSSQWVYVDDCCIQLLGAMIHGKKGEIYHMRPLYTEDMPCANITLVKLILKILGKGEYLIAKDKDEDLPKYISSLTGKNLLTLLILNDFPARGRTFEYDLRETVSWYEKNQNWWM